MPAQIEAAIEHAEITYKPRRTLYLIVADESGQLAIRFLNFYPSQVKEFQPGSLFRFSGEVRGGMFGLEMVHPRYRRTSPGAALPQSLTPGLSDHCGALANHLAPPDRKGSGHRNHCRHPA